MKRRTKEILFIGGTMFCALMAVITGLIQYRTQTILQKTEWKCTAFVMKDELKECVRYEKKR